MPWTFFIVEAVAILSFLAVGWEAWRQGARELSTLGSATAFGLAVEVLFVTQFHGYAYGDFLVSVPVGGGASIPLWVGLGWGTIIWLSCQAGNRSQLPWAVRPAMDALLALSLDLALDPIAEALGWWHWLRPSQFFGIPCDNFIGWVLIVGSYSFGLQAVFQRWPSGVQLWRDVLFPVVALVPSVLAVWGAQYPLEWLYARAGEPMVLFALCLPLLLLVFGYSGRARAKESPPWFLTGIPALYHGLFLFFLLATGVAQRVPELLIVLPLAAVASLSGFRFPRTNT